MSASIRLTRRLPLAPLVGALLAGCASAPAASTIETTAKRREMVAVGEQMVLLEPTVARAMREELAMPAERAWALLPLAYEALGLPLTTLDSERRLIGAGGVRAQGRLGGAWLSRYVDCGTAATGLANADSYAVTLDVVTQVDGSASGANAGVSTAIRASGRPASTSTSNPVNCVSRGTLERRVAEIVRERAAATP